MFATTYVLVLLITGSNGIPTEYTQQTNLRFSVCNEMALAANLDPRADHENIHVVCRPMLRS